MSWLINAAQLEKFRKNAKNMVILDVSHYGEGSERDAYAEFIEEHIVGARFMDIDQFCDSSSDLPNTVSRDTKAIANFIGSHGITNDYKVIFYDNCSHHTSARALWLFKLFGHQTNQLYIYDGDLADWKRNAGKVESGEPTHVKTKSYTAEFNEKYIRTLHQMKENISSPSEQVVDMRHPVRYCGGKEARAGLRSGHIPGSFSFPFMTMFESTNRFKPLEKIKSQLTGTGVQLEYPIVTSCGSGMTACILDFVLDLLGHTNHAVYDGSWSEWGRDTLYPGEMDLSERPVVTSLD